MAKEGDEEIPNYVISWGTNGSGQCMFGPGAAERCPLPGIVPSLQDRRVGHIFAGYDYSCVVTGKERLYAAGNNSGNFLAENSEVTDREDKDCLRTVQRVGFDELEASNFVAVSGGRDHLVTVTDTGAAISWGRSNEFGQCGHGIVGSLKLVLPAVVPGLPTMYKVVGIACGEYSTLALLSSGELYAWGANECGQLGVGDRNPREAPARIAGTARGVPFRAVAAGCHHGLALSRSGRVYTWGSAKHGMLGLKGALQAADGCVPAPSLVDGLPHAKSVSGGGAHSAVLVHKGQLFTAGDNRNGQLGIQRASVQYSDTFRRVENLKCGIRMVDCGAQHTLCLTFQGTVMGFGCNKEGQLGTGKVSPCEDFPVTAEMEKGAGGRRLLIYALVATQDHSCALAIPAPEHKDQLFRYLNNELGDVTKAPRVVRRSPAAAVVARTVSLEKAGGGAKKGSQRNPAAAGTSSFSLFCGGQKDEHSGQSVEELRADERDAGENSEHLSDAGANEDVCLHPALSGGRERLTCVKFTVPQQQEAAARSFRGRLSDVLAGSLMRRCLQPKQKIEVEHEEVVLFKPLVQPGVASKSFASLSTQDLLALVKVAQETQEWHNVAQSLGVVLRCPSVLNASFHFPGLREPRLCTEALSEALELTSAAPVTFQLSVLEAAAKGLEEQCVPAVGGPRTQEQLRGLIIYMMLPQLRDPKLAKSMRHEVLGQVAQMVVMLTQEERREMMSLFVNEVPIQVMREALVPALRAFLNERVRACAGTQPVQDARLWNGALLMQALYLANEKCRKELEAELQFAATSNSTMGTRFLTASDFHIQALDEDTIPPEVAYDQLLRAYGANPKLPEVSEVFFGPHSQVQQGGSALPQRLCIFMVHRNLLPVAFKQKVMQVSNTVRQTTLQQRHSDFGQILQALLAGQDPRPFFTLSVRRQNIVEDTVTKLQSADPEALRLPLRVRFQGEEGIDEGGVRREFFQILMSKLFDESYAMFVTNEDTRTTWFNTAALETDETNQMFRVCGMIIGLAAYNNQAGIQINLPMALFKKLKGELLYFADLEDVDPKVWMSLQQLLSWSPSSSDANREFEDTFALSFVTSYDFYGETRTVELKPKGENVSVNYDSRQEYVELYTKWVLETSVERQFKHLSAGFSQVVDSALWSMLTAEEARLVLCSEPDLDVADLRKGTLYEGFGPQDPYINDFWEVLHGFDVPKLKRFLVFVTGSDRAPLGGLHELKLKIQRYTQEPTERLPVSHTCFNLLQLPQYASKEKLGRKLLVAIENAEGFGIE